MAIKKDTLDGLLAGRDPQAVFAKDGLFDELKKALAERVLNAEIDDHLDGEAVLMQMPDPVKAIQIDGGSEFMAKFEQACANKNLPSTSSRRGRQSSTEPSSAAMEPGAMSSMPAPTSPCASTKSPKWSRPSNTSTSITTTDPTLPFDFHH